MFKVKRVTATRMRAERIRRGWSQTDLAFFARLTAPDISRFESGQMKPYPAQAARLSKVLGIDPGKLQECVER